MSNYLDQLPESLQTNAYRAAGEAAWPRLEALRVIDCLTNQGIAMLGVEIWLPTHPGPTIPTPILYTWEAAAREAGETWPEFVTRAKKLAREYIDQFTWDEADTAHKSLTPYFNLTLCQEEEYDKLLAILGE